ETATVLAALRYWQEDFGIAGGALRMPLHFNDCDPLTSKEIDDLCERINVVEGDDAEGMERFVREIADDETRCTCADESYFGEDHTSNCVFANAHELIYGYRPEGKP